MNLNLMYDPVVGIFSGMEQSLGNSGFRLRWPRRRAGSTESYWEGAVACPNSSDHAVRPR